MNSPTAVRAMMMVTVLSVAMPSVAADDAGKAVLERVTGEAVIERGAQSTRAAEGQNLALGERVKSGAASSAVIRFTDGCAYTLGASESLTIDAQSPCALCGSWRQHGALAASGAGTAVTAKTGGKGVATVVRIAGELVVNKGTRYVNGTEGMALSVGERIMSLAASTSIIQFKDGCRYTLNENERLTVEDESLCSLCRRWEQHGAHALDPSADAVAGGAVGALDSTPFVGVDVVGILGATLDTGSGNAQRPPIDEAIAPSRTLPTMESEAQTDNPQ